MRREKKHSHKKRLIIRGLLITIASAILTIGIIVISLFASLPSVAILNDRAIAESTKIFDSTGSTLLYELHGDEKRTVVAWDEIPDFVKQATISIEDAHFYEHAAVDYKAILRALLVNIREGGVTQGGSTITQQLAKKTFLSDERTLLRKIKELFLALSLENRFSKNAILGLYLNQIPYGPTLYGIESASRGYFNKSARDLTLEEAATLASIPKAPTYYSPWGSHKEALLARKNLVMREMERQGYISEEERVVAEQKPLVFKKQTDSIVAPHFVIAVQDYLNKKYGEDYVRSAGLIVTTTLDTRLQEIAERVVHEGARRNTELYKGTNAALVAEDPSTGKILALVGSRDYFDIAHDGNFNVATQGLRQPGSSIKPIVYVTAFEKGYTPDTIIFDLETEFDTTGNPKKSYKPQNYDGDFLGPISLRTSLALSRNVSSVKALYLAGIDSVLENAKKFGITSLSDRYRYGLSLVLGGGEVTLAELVGAYSVFPEEGIKNAQIMIQKVTTKDGKVLEEFKDSKGKRVIDAQYPRLINDILSDIEARRSLFQSSLNLTVFPGHQVALKTGTTNDYRDAWSLGYTKSLVVGVWAGNNDNTPMQKRGGSILAAVPIWSAFLKEALEGKELEPFTRPEFERREKPMLNGSYISQYSSAGIEYPQIHDILFYVNKKDPLGLIPKNPENDAQFETWEESVRIWAQKNIPQFFETYNRPLPEDSILKESEIQQLTAHKFSFTIMSPQNGIFAAARTQIYPIISIVAPQGIRKITMVLNGAVVFEKSEGLDQFTSSNPTVFSLPAITLPDQSLQNILEVILLDNQGDTEKQSVVIYE